MCWGGRGGYVVLSIRQINTCRKVPLQVVFLDDSFLHCLLHLSLIFLWYMANAHRQFRPLDQPPQGYSSYKTCHPSQYFSITMLHDMSLLIHYYVQYVLIMVLGEIRSLE